MQDKRGVSNIIVFVLGLVIVVAIVANVFLWNYEMNQLDWKKMQEDVSITNVESTNETLSYNPSEYALGGATSWVSGDISNLNSDDSVYMTFRSYTESTSDFVDISTSDVDSSPDKGTHANFSAQQAGPDSVYDTLTEENTEGIEDYVDNNTSDVDSSADLGDLINFDNMKATDSTYADLTESAPDITYINEAEASATSGTSAQVNKPTNTEENDFMIALLVSTIGSDTDGSTMSSAPSGWTNEYDYTQSATSGQHVYIYWKVAGASEPSSYTWTWTDSCGWVAQITTFRRVDTASPIHVEGTVNQEASGSPMSPSVTTTEDNCMIWLYDMSDDDDVPAGGGAPSGTTWIDQTEVADPGNGIGISTAYFVQASAGATGDKDWTLDASEENSGQQYALKPADTDYQLDQEVQFTAVIDFLPTEKLCIYTGTLSDEDLRVDYWNGTGWENLATDLTAYSCSEHAVSLTSANFTIRFKDGTTSGDTTQDQWQIDASLLRVEGAGSKEDAVDQQSNVDGPADVGTHSNFTAQKYGPDSVYDTLTEGNTAGSSNSTLLDDGFEAVDWDANWDDTSHNWQEDNFNRHSGSASARARDFNEGFFTCDSLDASGASAIYVDFWFRKRNTESTDFTLYYYDGSNYDFIDELDDNGGDNTWLHYTEKVTDNQYFVSNFRIRFDATLEGGGPGGEEVHVDDILIKKETQTATNYELDLEVQWTYLPYLLPNEQLCIYNGTMGDEDLKVDVWNGTGWETVFSDLSSGWNNVSITDWLTDSNLTIRFKDGTETGDTNPDTWQIDVALVHIWSDGGESYELDLEVQWTSAEYTQINEELCIKAGAFSGSENLQVKARSGGSWVWVMNLTANQWNNVSVTSYLTGSTFTIQFLGGSETTDTTQDNWNIDVTLLVWSNEYTMEVEFVGSSNTEDWSQLNWTVNSAWTIGSVSVTLQLYNHTLGGYPASGNGYIAYTSDITPDTDENKSQTISVNPTHFRNATGHWKMKVKGVKATDTQFDFKADWIEFKAAKPVALFTFENEGSPTVHLVSLWVNNSTHHQRYDINIFINSADTESYTTGDISLPDKPYTVKVVTARGNTAVYSAS